MKSFLFLLLVSSPAFSHEGHGPEMSWNWDPAVLLTLAAVSALYIKGLQNLKSFKSIKAWQKLSFFAGILFLLVALVSPVDLLSDYLSSMHMIQHMIIMMISAPLFVLGAPMYVLLWSLPASWRKKVTPLYQWLYGRNSGRYFFWQPLLLWALYAFILWIWHLPKFYEAALMSKWIHDLQHISFFLASCLFCRVLIDPFHRLKLAHGPGILYLFTTSLHATLLGAFMTLSPSSWYKFYEGRTSTWNLSALEDQQIAGLIMWMPACTVYLFLAVYLFFLWTRELPVETSAQGKSR